MNTSHFYVVHSFSFSLPFLTRYTWLTCIQKCISVYIYVVININCIDYYLSVIWRMTFYYLSSSTHSCFPKKYKKNKDIFIKQLDNLHSKAQFPLYIYQTSLRVSLTLRFVPPEDPKVKIVLRICRPKR